jgi:hypothetical protein
LGPDLYALGRKGGSGGESALRVAVEQLASQAADGITRLLLQVLRGCRRCTAGAVQRTCAAEHCDGLHSCRLMSFSKRSGEMGFK